jgi:CTP-dependent riboflavin kinase
LEGEVVSGSGEGAEYLRLTWVRQQIEAKLGFAPYPGTLNIRLRSTSLKERGALIISASAEIAPQPGYCVGKLFEAFIQDTKCGVVIPLVSGYPEDVIEIVASVNLREKLGLFDGSLVSIRIMF